jgi:hypothetical protein
MGAMNFSTSIHYCDGIALKSASESWSFEQQILTVELTVTVEHVGKIFCYFTS